MGDARVEQIKRAHASARPTNRNPAWLNTHGDLGYVLAKYAELGRNAGVPWISVNDRLPTQDDYGEHDDVLVRYRYTDAPDRPWSVGESFHDMDHDHNGGWCFGSCYYAEVTHWMPKSALLDTNQCVAT